jgi:hypothetical protein
VKIKVEVLLVVMPCSVAIGYQCFGGPCCLHLQGEVNGTGKGGMDMDMEFGRIEPRSQ